MLVIIVQIIQIIIGLSFTLIIVLFFINLPILMICKCILYNNGYDVLLRYCLCYLNIG